MAKRGGLAQEFYIGGYDLSGDVGSIERCAAPRAVQEIGGINNSAVERLMLRADGIMEWRTWFNDAALQAHAGLSGLPTGERIVTWILVGNTRGGVACTLNARQINYDPTGAADGSLSLAVKALGTSPATLGTGEANPTPSGSTEWGYVITAGEENQTSAGSLTGYQNTDSAVALVMYAHLTNFTGTSITVTVQESSDNGSSDAWTTIGTIITAATAAPASGRETDSSTIEDYLRVTTTGTFSNADLVVMVRKATGTNLDDY